MFLMYHCQRIPKPKSNCLYDELHLKQVKKKMLNLYNKKGEHCI
jgi:hypothetical protein